jgi:choline dehydrogenase-like flavoprotein
MATHQDPAERPEDRIEADFVVVGAGSAGCAVAARLSEDPATRVLLLEAGGADKNRWIHIPLGFGKTFADPSVNWCYETEPDPGAADRRVFWPRGKVLGGSSSITAWSGSAAGSSFDHWRQLGNAGWSFEDVLPYFRRSGTRCAAALPGSGARSACRMSHSTRSARPSSPRRPSSASLATTTSTAPAGRCRLPPDDDAQWQALLDRRRLSAPGNAAAQSASSPGQCRITCSKAAAQQVWRFRQDDRLCTAHAARQVILRRCVNCRNC